jgi:hypothetical protein
MARAHFRMLPSLLTAALAASLITLVASADSADAVPAKPVQPAGSESSTMAIAGAQARKTGKAVEVTSATTPTQQIMANPDGTLTLNLNPLPVRTKRGATWLPLDPTLRRNSDGTYSPRASASGLVLSGGGSGPLATVNNGRKALSISWPSPLPSPIPSPTVSGPVATYANVLPGVDLVVTATVQGGFSHSLVVHDAIAAANPALATLRLVTSGAGLTLTADPAGNITATDGVGHPVFTAPTALMWDSPVPPAPAPNSKARTLAPSAATEPGQDATIAPVGVTVSGDTVTLTPDRAMLTAKSTQWPVIIDPSWNPTPTASGRSAWTYISDGFPDVKYYNVNDYARVGHNGWEKPYFRAVSFFEFPIPTFLWGTEITRATLQTKEVWSADNNRQWVDVNVTCPINAGTDWNHPPCKGRLIDRQNTPGNWRDDHSDNPMEADWDVTGAIAEAATTHWSTDTLGLYNETDDPRGWRRFYNNPTVAIEFNTPPNTPAQYATSPETPCDAGASRPAGLVGSTAVTFSAVLSDPDGSQGQVEADYTITDKTTGTTLATPSLTVSNNQTASVTVPASKFTDGHAYAWNVSAFDGRTRSRPTPTCQFIIDHQQPGIPVITSTTYPTGSTGAPARTPATFTFTPPSGTEKPTRYVYSLNTPPPAPLPRGNMTFSGAVAVPADQGGGSTNVTITPRRVGFNVLYVYAVDAAGNPSAAATYMFQTAALTDTDVTGDLTGDGVPDAVVAGTAAMPGLWLYPGTDKTGRVSSASQIGAAGLAKDGTGAATDWTGVPVGAADFTMDGIQDLLVKLPHADADGNVTVLPGLGDGSPVDPSGQRRLALSPIDPNQTGSQTVDQIVAAPITAFNDPPLPDLYAIVGDDLYFYSPLLPPATAYSDPEWLGRGWAGRTITATSVGSNPALFSRDKTTGELDLWVGDAANGVRAGDPASTKITYATSGFNATTVPTITSADLDVDGKPDLWTTTSDGKLNAYRNNGANGLAAPVASPLAPTGPFHSGIFNKCLDATDTLGSAGHPVQVRDCANNIAQTWTTPGDGTIRVNNQCLDISYEHTDNGSQVSLYTCIAGAPAQQWTRTTLGGLRNPKSGRCLDVVGSGTSGQNGTGVQIWDCNGSPQQSFTLNRAVGMFRSGIAGKCLNNKGNGSSPGNPVTIFDCSNAPAQTWTTPGDGTIRINGMCVEAAGGGTGNGTKIQLGTCAGTPGQLWQAGPDYSLVNLNSGRCLDDPGYSATNQTQLQLYDCAANTAQSWGLHLTIIGPMRSVIPVKCVQDAENGITNNNPVQLWDCNGGASQLWTAPGDGTIRINGMCLDIANASTDNFSKVEIYNCAGNGAQQWITGPNNSIVNPASGRCLDTPYGAPTNGNQLWIYDCNGGNAQNWTLPY